MDNLLACVLMVVISFPLAFLIARTCLRGVLRVVTGETNRDVL
jgi:hypothetical protein